MKKSEIENFHLKTGLEIWYKYHNQETSKSYAVLTLLKSIRPFIEAYQKKYSNDFHGDKLDLYYTNLATTYYYASKILHLDDIPDDIFMKFTPKKLKHDLKLIFKSVIGSQEYKKTKESIKDNRHSNSIGDYLYDTKLFVIETFVNDKVA